MLLKPTLIRLTKNCQINGTQKNTKLTEEKLRPNSMISMKLMMSSQTTIEDLTTMKLLTETILIKMQIEPLIVSINNMEPKMNTRSNSSTNTTQKEKEIITKFQESQEMHHKVIYKMLIENWLYNTIPKAMKETLKQERDSMKSTRPITPFHLMPEETIMTLFLSVKLLLSELTTSLKISGQTDSTSQKKLMNFSGQC